MPPLKVFLSSSVDVDDRVLIWRLQTLATAQGVDLYVPALTPGEKKRSAMPQAVRRAIDRADFVLAIITNRTASNVREELNYAAQKNKVIIPLVERSLASDSFLKHLAKVFYFSQGEPMGQLEYEVGKFLKEEKKNKEARQTIGAVIAIGLGLFALSTLNQD